MNKKLGQAILGTSDRTGMLGGTTLVSTNHLMLRITLTAACAAGSLLAASAAAQNAGATTGNEPPKLMLYAADAAGANGYEQGNPILDPAQSISNGGGAGTPEYPCPQDCTTVIHHVGDIVHHCQYGGGGRAEYPFVQYIPNSGNNATCDPGVALDVEPRHRLFVHGLHSNAEAWDYWYDRVKKQMDYMGFQTVRDNTGWSAFFGDGTMPLLSQVDDLASQINDAFASFPNGPIDVYAHSLGALKVEALLQLGYARGARDPWFQAARRIDRVYIFQGAHGGCGATAANGDRPAHGGFACPASRDIGFVNDAHLNGLPNLIPGSSEIWDMSKIVWNGQKHLYYVVATSNGGEKSCNGATMGLICRGSMPNDGVVYGWQMVPAWYAHFDEAVAAGYVSVIVAPGVYCHVSDDAYDPPRLSTSLMNDYIGLKKVRYLVPEWTHTQFEHDVTYCNEACFCREDVIGACKNRLDCSLQSGLNCSIVPDTGSGNPTPAGHDWTVDDRIFFTNPDITGQFFTIPDIADQVSWSHCAAEGRASKNRATTRTCPSLAETCARGITLVKAPSCRRTCGPAGSSPSGGRRRAWGP